MNSPFWRSAALTPGDEGSYPRDDIQAALGPDGQWLFTHKDGRRY